MPTILCLHQAPASYAMALGRFLAIRCPLARRFNPLSRARCAWNADPVPVEVSVRAVVRSQHEVQGIRSSISSTSSSCHHITITMRIVICVIRCSPFGSSSTRSMRMRLTPKNWSCQRCQSIDLGTEAPAKRFQESLRGVNPSPQPFQEQCAHS